MSDRDVRDATRSAFVGKLTSVHDTRCDGSLALPDRVTVLHYRASQILLAIHGTQALAVVRVAAPVASAVAQAWGWF